MSRHLDTPSLLPGRVAVALGMLTACTPSLTDVGHAGGSETSAGSTAGEPDTDGASPETTGGTTSGDGGIRLDVGGSEGDQERCGKVDFLFVVDNSDSMWQKQQTLVASFPGFLSAIRDTVGVDDVQIMVVDTDANDWDGAGEEFTDCATGPDPEQCCQDVCDYFFWEGTCGGVQCPGPPTPTHACDVTLGGGRTKDQYREPCGVGDGPTGRRFMTGTDPGLLDAFNCIGTVGDWGDPDERQMEAAIDAVTKQAAPGGCNDGFVRDDAVLVITIITDEKDSFSAGDAYEWRDRVLAAKSGNADAVVTLALLGDHGRDGSVCAAQQGYVIGQDAPRIRGFARSFPFGRVGSVCMPDYTGFFAEAIEAVDAACEVFVPPG